MRSWRKECPFQLRMYRKCKPQRLSKRIPEKHDCQAGLLDGRLLDSPNSGEEPVCNGISHAASVSTLDGNWDSEEIAESPYFHLMIFIEPGRASAKADRHSSYGFGGTKLRPELKSAVGYRNYEAVARAGTGNGPEDLWAFGILAVKYDGRSIF